MNSFFPRLAPVAALCLPLLALAQAGRPDPADAKAPASALRYPSAFADYKPWQETKPGDWRAVNDNVRQAGSKGGGHAGHQMSPAPPAAASAPAAKSPAPAHSGHPTHGGKQ
jgi:hypothetical protein